MAVIISPCFLVFSWVGTEIVKTGQAGSVLCERERHSSLSASVLAIQVLALTCKPPTSNAGGHHARPKVFSGF